MPVDVAELPAIRAVRSAPAPTWALLQRHLLAAMCEAALWFTDRYTRRDGTLVWRPKWPGMDGSDDGYEAFGNFPLLYALGGDARVLDVARRQWEAVTWQFTEYGQVWREFDAYYDWMHHGESCQILYHLGLADPTPLKERQRAVRFADMYTGDDPLAPNYDRERRLMRSPLTGSRGPRLRVTAEDWSTHRAVLDGYPPPFEDLPGVDPAAARCPWTDDAVFAAILERMNARMTEGDVPLNLAACGLVTHAYLHTGLERYRRFVLEYLGAWAERAAANGGLLPDNVGPSGRIGERMDGGKWWGGYYGWRWPHGAWVMQEAAALAGCCALLLTGRDDGLDLVRSQLDLLWQAGREEDGRRLVPNRRLDAGWTDFRPADGRLPVLIWNATRDEADRGRVERARRGQRWDRLADHIGKGDQAHTLPWYLWTRGELPGYPEAILRLDERHLARRLEAIRGDRGDPASWDVHHWQDLNPVLCEGLVHTTWGAPMPIYHGGLLHAPVRYFDAEAGRAGLPPGVGALATSSGPREAVVQLVNLDPLHSHCLVVQGGAYGEHRILRAVDLDGGGPPVEVHGRWLRVDLAPAAGIRLGLEVERHAARPGYGGPWDPEPSAEGLLRGRDSDETAG
jgi:hypothetical protein